MVTKPKSVNNSKKQNNFPTADLDTVREAAQIKGALSKEWLRTAKAEERSRFLKDMVKKGMGTNNVRRVKTLYLD